MNKENLLKAADFVEKIPQWSFSMECYRKGDNTKTECDSVGCALGHLTGAFPEMVTFRSGGDINFEKFADDVFELEDPSWMWCFASEWSMADNTQQGCADRIRFLVESGEAAAKKAWYASEAFHAGKEETIL